MTEDYEHQKKANRPITPIILAAGIAVLLFGLVIFLPLAIVGAIIIGGRCSSFSRMALKKNLLNSKNLLKRNGRLNL